MDFSKPVNDQSLSNAAAALAQNGITVDIVENKEQAKEKVKNLIPKESKVMTMTSITLEQTGIKELIDDSGYYYSIRNNFPNMSADEKRCQGSVPDWSIASVHAVTENGQIIIASNTGSQLPAAAYGAKNVVFVVGTQKIVKDLEEAWKRIEYILPFESKRSQAAYNLPETWQTFPSKILILQKEIQEGRIHLIFVKETLGF